MKEIRKKSRWLAPVLFLALLAGVLQCNGKKKDSSQSVDSPAGITEENSMEKADSLLREIDSL